MSSGITNFKSLIMTDANGQRLAEFLVMDEIVISIPSFALMHITENDQSAPIGAARPGRRWQIDFFIRYLVDVCAQYKHEPLVPSIDGVILDTLVNAGSLARLTGNSVEYVREVLANHLTFPDQVRYLS